MPSLTDLSFTGCAAGPCRPWPRTVLDEAGWTFAIDQLAEGRWTLFALWGEEEFVHMTILEEATGGLATFTWNCRESAFPSVARRHAPANRLERAVRDLWGHTASGANDLRPWLDHGRWPDRPTNADSAMTYPFLDVEGESLHQIPVGPVHAGIIEPGHFRFTASGETIVRLEERLGYVHKGVGALMQGADAEKALRLAGRVSGDSTAAYALAFSRAYEAASNFDVTPRAAFIRALIVEIERIANHLGDFGAICNDASFPLIQTHCMILREQALRAADVAFGHRLMRDVIAPGGVARDLTDDARAAIASFVAAVEKKLPILMDAYEETSSLQDRTVGTGRLDASLARRFGAGGFIGRASGRSFDARRTFAFAPYDALRFDVPALDAGDVDARVRIRVREIDESLSLIRQILDVIPTGSIAADVGPTGAAEGAAVVEGFRGDIFAFVRVDADGRVAQCALRDPSWFQWPLLEAAVEGNIVADFPLCNKSFNCSYSGHDL